MRKKRALLSAALLILAALAAVISVLFYTGVLQFNRPSKERYPVRGVDVSHYQGEIDWEVLSSQGISFAYIKATEGSFSTDERFSENWSGAGKTGLRIGAYHFFSFETAGKTQAEIFIGTVDALSGMLPPAADVEPYGKFRKLTPGVLDELSVWLSEVEAHYGIRPVIYTTAGFCGTVREAFPEHDIWIRSVYGKPSGKTGWTFWQYSDRAKKDGYGGDEKFIDMNVFAGTEEEFRNYGIN